MTRTAGVTTEAPTPRPPSSPSGRTPTVGAASGQAGGDPTTGTFASADVGGQTVQTFKNIAAVLAASGASLDDVIRVDVYLSDMADFAAMNEEYQKVFAAPYPARTTVGVSLPAGMKVEITALAVTP